MTHTVCLSDVGMLGGWCCVLPSFGAAEVEHEDDDDDEEYTDEDEDEDEDESSSGLGHDWTVVNNLKAFKLLLTFIKCRFTFSEKH
jgi:hypothetical protein